MSVFARAITYASLFIGLVLVYIPAQLLSWTGASLPSTFGPQQVAGMLLASVGGAIALWCILVFASSGRGTPAPFDPPRRLVVRGPYRYVRNPMYMGAGLALAGAAMSWESWSLLAYAGIFLLTAHLFVVLYEEPALRRAFGVEYEVYCHRVRRWWPQV